MAKFKVGDKVEMVKRDGYYADFKNPGAVDRVDDEDSIADVFLDTTDSAGRFFTGADESRFTAYVEPQSPFKTGDEVEVIHGAGTVADGTRGVVLECLSDVLVRFEGRTDLHSNGGRSESNDLWWFPVESLIIASEVEKSDKHWIIAKLNGGLPLPSPHPFKHLSEIDAVIEAQRLATANPGVKFVMYAARYEAFVEPPKPVEPDLKLRWL